MIWLAALTVVGSVILCSMVGFHIERAWRHALPLRRRRDRATLWLLRGVGPWIVFWFVFPVITQSQARQPPDLTLTNANQIQINAQRLGSVESRVAAVEALRLDTRLALLEQNSAETKETVGIMRNWTLSILGGVVIMVITQVLQLIGRGAKPGDPRHAR